MIVPRPNGIMHLIQFHIGKHLVKLKEMYIKIDSAGDDKKTGYENLQTKC